MNLSSISCDVLDFLKATRRHPGARVALRDLERHIGTEPAVAAALSELTHAGLVTAPDKDTIELTARGFDVINRGTYRTGVD